MKKQSATYVMKPAEMIDYQQSSIVSREIIRKKTGTVTLFAFDAGQGLSEHSAPFDALVFVVDGEAEITVSKKKYTVSKNSTILLPAGQPHSLKAIKRFKMLLIMVRS